MSKISMEKTFCSCCSNFDIYWNAKIYIYRQFWQYV